MKTPPLPLPRAAILFRLLGDECRLRLLLALSQRGPLSVSELCTALGKSQPTVSHQLRLLRGAGVVSRGREGTSRVYSLAAGQVRELLRVVQREGVGDG